MIQDVVSFSDSLCSGKCVRCRIILPLYYFPLSVCHSPLCPRCGAGVCCHSAPPDRPGAGLELSPALSCCWPCLEPEPQCSFPGDCFPSPWAPTCRFGQLCLTGVFRVLGLPVHPMDIPSPLLPHALPRCLRCPFLCASL